MPSPTCLNHDKPPVFVKPLGEKYICCRCNDVLNPPVVQTTCGHRLGDTCVRALLGAGEGATAPCPGQEEDCQPLSTDTIYPDNATTKELQRFNVYCSNKEHGCGVVMPWLQLPTHEAECAFRTIQCSNEGCPRSILASDLRVHTQGECEFIPTLCEHCDALVPRKHVSAHVTECSSMPRKCAFHQLGCDFEGRPDKYKEHLTSSLGSHTAKTVQEMETLKLDQSAIVAKVSEMEEAIHTLEKSLKSIESKEETQVQTMQKSLTKLSDNLNGIKAQVEKRISRDQLESYTEQVNEIKKITSSHDSRIAHLESGSSAQQASGDLVNKVRALESKVGAHDVRFAESDLRVRLLETASFDGKLIWRIPSYSRRKQDAVEGRTLSLYSQPFYSSYYGYKMCARVYLNGDGLGKGSHLSLFFVIMRGEYDPLLTWPFRQKVTISLLDQSGNRKHITDTFRPDPTSTSFRKPVGEMNIASGSPLFAPHAKVESDAYLRDDTLFVCVTVDKTDLVEAWV